MARIAPGLGDRVELLKHLAFDLHVFEHRLDDQIAVREGGQIRIGREQRHCALDLFAREPPLRRRRLVILPNHADAARERFRVQIDQPHRNADRQEVHGDAAAHGACADHADLGDGRGLHRGIETLDFRGLPFRKEQVAQRGRLRSGEQALEFRALDHPAFAEGQCRCLDRADHGIRRLEAEKLACMFFAKGGHGAGIRSDAALAGARQRPQRSELARERRGLLVQ